MQIIVEWDNEEKTILAYRFLKDWNWDELRIAFQEAYDLIDTVNHRVNVIMDFSNASLFAPNGVISKARHVVNNPKHPNVGLTTAVGSGFISTIFSMMTRMMGNTALKWDVVFVNNLDEAYKAIAQYESEKPDEEARR